MNETITVKDGQAAVTTTAVSGTLSPKSSATDIITVVKTANGDQAAVKVVDLGGGGGGGGDYLPLSGGTVSGDVAVEGILKVGGSIFKEQYNILSITPWSGQSFYQMSSSYFRGTGTDQTLGGGGNFWANVYTKKLNNGADLAVPTEGGTLARMEDIDEAVGSVSTLLDAINGEVL